MKRSQFFYGHLQSNSPFRFGIYQKFGDGTNLVVVLAGELLQQADTLLRLGLHPSEIIEGYEIGTKKALHILDGKRKNNNNNNL